tara:strand:- start:4137 stop:4277 length:141 start_codon:yes stop_codon:yes gene_type:complete
LHEPGHGHHPLISTSDLDGIIDKVGDLVINAGKISSIDYAEMLSAS